MRFISAIFLILHVGSVPAQFLLPNLTLPFPVPPAVSNILGLDILQPLNDLKNAIDTISDDECRRQMNLYIDGVGSMEEWALRMLDATAKVQSGLLEGNLMHVGHYDECLKIDVAVNESQIYGQYCTLYITEGITEIPTSLAEYFALYKKSYGLCVPVACNTTSLDQIGGFLEEYLGFPYHFNFDEDLCMSKVKPRKFSIAAILSMAIFGSLGGIVIFSTLYDIYLYKKQKRHDPSFFTAFSFYTNGKKLLSTKKSPDSLDCLNGLRVISIIWIVGGHRYLFTTFMPLINLADVLEWPEKWVSGLVTASNIAVDTFFLISGLLVVYVYLLYKEKGRSMTLGMFYLHRFLRLTPALAGVVLVYATLLEHIDTGPFWKCAVRLLEKDCQQNWWSTLLYFQNYVHPNNGCIRHTWYLSVDTQLYVLSPLLLFPLVKNPKCTMFLVTCLMALSCGLASVITWWKDLTSAYFGVQDDEMKYLYGVTHIRAVAWLAGFQLGYFLFLIRNRPIKINKVVRLLCWVVSLSIMVGVIAYHSVLSKELTQLETVLANGLLRLAWSLAMSVIIFLCVTGPRSAINKFLSSPIFTVLIRINYSVYLVHMIIIICSLGQSRTPHYESFLDNFYYFWGDYIISSLLAVVWTLVFESPILALEKLIFGKEKPKQNDVVVVSERFSIVNIEVINNLENGLNHGKIISPQS